ncbi:protein-S-isoprenylcysteine O-methyltransferase [Zymoseptoria brevis]|uniref:Protein-S-isoprenylcysteine O-methyltransferase n=1 Tax=Zymoseptoria brevis TaxID=1047168 RepID=A0A0F4G7A6_9PEZI|nr:protein-S-isoprenylcysteine O-methyltransferase [Zymoseptoria brevis]
MPRPTVVDKHFDSTGASSDLPTNEEERPLTTARRRERADSNEESSEQDEDTKPVPFDPTLLPKGSRDLSFIGIQAFFLGTVFASCAIGAIYFLRIGSTWWRLPIFFVCLSIFHFLEYYTTARYNVPACRASSFLLFNNGSAYASAHGAASIEIVISALFPAYQSWLVRSWTITAGLIAIIVGQIVRSIAMKQAGTNFNHIVATERKESHQLVTSGIYGYLRHPSYFGFFWWALGTQFLVGNKVCAVGYAVALWRFFNKRTFVEEKFLVNFFGKQYEEYKKRTGTMIPLIR